MTGLPDTLTTRPRHALIIWATVWWMAALAAAGAQGQTVYRCANGSYADAPCPGGRPVDVADPRSPAQQRQASDAARREQALARQLAQDRRASERQALRQPPPLAGIGRRPPEVPAAAAPTASPPKAPRKRSEQRSEKSSEKRADKRSDSAAAKPKAPRQRTATEPARDARAGRMGQY